MTDCLECKELDRGAGYEHRCKETNPRAPDHRCQLKSGGHQHHVSHEGGRVGRTWSREAK